MVVDTICVVRSQDRSECVNQDVLFLGTSESTVAVFLGGEWNEWGNVASYPGCVGGERQSGIDCLCMHNHSQGVRLRLEAKGEMRHTRMY